MKLRLPTGRRSPPAVQPSSYQATDQYRSTAQGLGTSALQFTHKASQGTALPLCLFPLHVCLLTEINNAIKLRKGTSTRTLSAAHFF